MYPHNYISAFRVLMVTCLLAPWLIGCKAVIASQLPEDHANQVIVALSQNSIEANKTPEGSSKKNPRFRIEVSSGDASRALSVLHAANLPKREAAGWHEIFGNTGIIPTSIEENARLAAAVSGELSRTIEAIPGVLYARVHISLMSPAPTRLDETAKKPKASVMVKYRPAEASLDTASIKTLIAGAVQDMEPEQVSVIGIEAEPIHKYSPELVRFGPITLSRESAPIAKAVTGILLSALLFLAILTLVLFGWLRRNSKTKIGA